MNNRLVLILAEKGYRQKGLLYSLRSMLVADIVVSDNPNTILQFRAPGRPRLVLIDSSISHSDSEEMLERIRANMPESSCVLLVDGNPAFRTKSGAEFDGVIRKDVPVEEFIVEIEAYLSSSSATSKTQ